MFAGEEGEGVGVNPVVSESREISSAVAEDSVEDAARRIALRAAAWDIVRDKV